MKTGKNRTLFHKRKVEKIIIIVASFVFIYLLISLYFTNHFFFHTEINGINVSLKSCNKTENYVRNYIKDYKLILIERNGEREEIIGQEIEMQYNKTDCFSQIYENQNSLLWISSLFKRQNYYIKELYTYNKGKLHTVIDDLNCLTKEIVNPENVSFQYSNGTYKVLDAVYGDKVIKKNLNEAIKRYILSGKPELNLEDTHCYEYPEYTLNAEKTQKTKKLLNKYVSAKITYTFGDKIELVDGNIINEWLSVDEDLEVVISKEAVMKYVHALSKQYDTVGITRKFKTALGKIVEVKGGLYGFKINQEAETRALLENINLGTTVNRDPIYTQEALFRGEDEIGSTYVEINITRQYLWFYKDGKLITQGAVVTGNPNRGYATVLGTYMLNYKQKGVTLIGPGYEADVTYWMPFYGNIGIHDASWRSAFGGEIYKRRGSHGCVNAPFYLAETIFNNIEEGIPIICYEE